MPATETHRPEQLAGLRLRNLDDSTPRPPYMNAILEMDAIHRNGFR